MEFTLTKVQVGESILVSVCSFNNGTSHICVDGDCWTVVSGLKLKPIALLFGGAMEALKKLPIRPDLYKPYQKYLKEHKLKVLKS